MEETPSLRQVWHAFGAFIRERRQALGLTGPEVARAAELSNSMVYGMENGKFPPPGREAIGRLAEVLQVPVDQLMSLAGKIDPARLRSLWSGDIIVRGLIASGLSEENARNLKVATLAYLAENEADHAGRVP